VGFVVSTNGAQETAGRD